MSRAINIEWVVGFFSPTHALTQHKSKNNSEKQRKGRFVISFWVWGVWMAKSIWVFDSWESENHSRQRRKRLRLIHWWISDSPTKFSCFTESSMALEHHGKINEPNQIISSLKTYSISKRFSIFQCFDIEKGQTIFQEFCFVGKPNYFSNFVCLSGDCWTRANE